MEGISQVPLSEDENKHRTGMLYRGRREKKAEIRERSAKEWENGQARGREGKVGTGSARQLAGTLPAGFSDGFQCSTEQQASHPMNASPNALQPPQQLRQHATAPAHVCFPWCKTAHVAWHTSLADSKANSSEAEATKERAPAARQKGERGRTDVLQAEVGAVLGLVLFSLVLLSSAVSISACLH
jgi:hypothetical protein